MAITAGGYGVSAPFVERTGGRVAFGLGLGLGAGVGKELLDLRGPGHPSWRDLTWDLAGSSVGLGLALGAQSLVRRAPPQRVLGRRRVFLRVSGSL